MLRTGDGLVPAVIFIVLGSANSIWVLVDFIRILVNGLQPQNGSYHKQNHYSAPAQPSNPQNQLEALERLAKLHERGIITDEEFEQKKRNFFRKPDTCLMQQKTESFQNESIKGQTDNPKKGWAVCPFALKRKSV